MFSKSPLEVKLDAEIQAALKELENHKKTSEEYGTIVKHIATLHKLKTESETPRYKQISPDTVLIVVANIFGILLLTRFERENVITGKALGFVKRL